ncbi:hypothetical protein VCRA2122O12_50127 [Vibrio crassostreae]|nr:hypothetical protein VCRA2114E5_50110 [Vibrio crassostreae]CAK2102847.1 hypothetical protein VCRA2110O4_50108 [Vibrio crassostreae]CAK2109471.1 hypothetical protein VCRA2110O1_50127 [Vibrio crassostreae]CAK2885743.1 hypothetical protein VCRA2110O3_50108 [Vibrio crassostreae]CAK2978288.1 hypothetical protein VCRA2122O10_50126 [Vibrio crassostreae]
MFYFVVFKLVFVFYSIVVFILYILMQLFCHSSISVCLLVKCR